PPTPAVHFKLYFYAAVLQLIEHLTHVLGSFTATCEQFPFLTGYSDELAAHGLHGLTLHGAAQRWREAVYAWEAAVPGELPLRATLRHLQALGLLHILNPEAPRAEWVLQLPGLLWEAIGGDEAEWLAPWAHYRQPAHLTTLDALILPEPLSRQLAQVPALLASGDVHTLIVRGPQYNGRHTLLGAVARLFGRGVLVTNG